MDATVSGKPSSALGGLAIPRKLIIPKGRCEKLLYMFKHHTKTKGNLGVLKAKLDLFQQGFMILNSETEHAPFDLVIYKNGIFKTVQVKYRSLNRHGALEIVFRGSHYDSTGTVNRPIDKTVIDLFVVYCPETDGCYYFNPDDFNKSITLRVNTSRNNQKQNIHFADDYRKVP